MGNSISKSLMCDANNIYLLVQEEQIEDGYVVIENYVYHELLENV